MILLGKGPSQHPVKKHCAYSASLLDVDDPFNPFIESDGLVGGITGFQVTKDSKLGFTCRDRTQADTCNRAGAGDIFLASRSESNVNCYSPGAVINVGEGDQASPVFQQYGVGDKILLEKRTKA